MRQQILSYPLPFVYLQHMKDSYRSDLGIQHPDQTLIPDNIRAEYDVQDALLWKCLHDRLSQALMDRLYNTHTFSQMCPSIMIDDGVHKGRGVDLAFSICFCHREDHSQIETRVRSRLYSYHLAMKSQPLPLLLTEIRTDLAQARKSGVKISWSESGSKWVNTIASRSILIGQDVAPYAPTGAKRKTLEDSNDSITLLFDFVDAVESSLKLAEEHDDTRQAHGVFQIANPGARDAWHSAVNPTQV